MARDLSITADVELLRADVRAQDVAFLTELMTLTEAEAASGAVVGAATGANVASGASNTCRSRPRRGCSSAHGGGHGAAVATVSGHRSVK